MLKAFYKIRCAAIILLAAGYGWAGGHYIPADSTIVSYLFQFIVIGLLLAMGSAYISGVINNPLKRNWTSKGLTIFSIFSLLVNILNIIHGAYNKDVHSFGSHNSLADLVPIIIIISGTILWLITLKKSRSLS
ncbi:MAG: hypothetical protein M3R72_11930 [Bacteroidota bacterium]|nr:hypothetical protein [Bacteroidota bacterium]